MRRAQRVAQEGKEDHMPDSETLRTCARCREDKPLTAYGTYKPAADGLRKTCKACMSVAQRRTGARVPRTRTGEGLPYMPPPFAPQPPIPAPNAQPERDPFAGAPAVGPYQVNVSRPGPLPTANRYPACSRACAALVVGRVKPPTYREVHHDARGSGYRAVLRPALTRVTACERSGACAACGNAVVPREARRPPSTLDMFD